MDETRRAGFSGAPSPGPVDIRPIRTADADGYLALLDEIDRETTFRAWEPGERAIELEDLRRALERADGSARLHLVAACDERLVGFLAAHRGAVRRFARCADFTMAVLESQRRRQLGTRFLQQMERWADGNGIDRVELTVMSRNVGARALYEKCGYALEGVKRRAIWVDGEPVDECAMGKLLR